MGHIWSLVIYNDIFCVTALVLTELPASTPNPTPMDIVLPPVLPVTVDRFSHSSCSYLNWAASCRDFACGWCCNSAPASLSAPQRSRSEEPRLELSEAYDLCTRRSLSGLYFLLGWHNVNYWLTRLPCLEIF